MFKHTRSFLTQTPFDSFCACILSNSMMETCWLITVSAHNYCISALNHNPGAKEAAVLELPGREKIHGRRHLLYDWERRGLMRPTPGPEQKNPSWWIASCPVTPVNHSPYLSRSSPVETTVSLHLPHYLFFRLLLCQTQEKREAEGPMTMHTDRRRTKPPPPLNQSC